jgi:hypothetical protein
MDMQSLGSRALRRLVSFAAVGTLAVGLLVAAGSSTASAKKAGPTVLYVGTYKGIATPAAQTYPTIQDAVDHATKGDWILIAPGDYHENDDLVNPPTSSSDISLGWYGGVDVETPDLHLRGMNRNSVIVDGTAPTAATPCSPLAADQEQPAIGRNGIMVWQAKDVSIDNLTVCNFLAGSGYSGNEIWWNGGKTDKIGLKGFEGSYLTATSTYFQSSQPSGDVRVCGTCAQYGMFASHAAGEGTLDELYANNMSDSGVYVGACKRVCGTTIDNATMEDNALGYSGTNSGGQILVENSTFDNNKDGFDTNTALSGDLPPPQDGRCPGNKPLAGSVVIPGTSINSCWVFEHNLVEDNNNANVPIVGTAGLGPTGTGMTVSGGRYDTVMDNQFVGNGAWGILFAPYPETDTTYNGKTCKQTGGINVSTNPLLGGFGIGCIYDPMSDVLLDNTFSANGTLGNPSNADFGNLVLGGHEWENCFSGNTDGAGAATDANVLDGNSGQTSSTCGARTPKVTGVPGANTDQTLLVQAECDAGVISGCSSGYPAVTGVTMQPLPGTTLTDPAGTTLPSMPNPCLDVPTNLWCPGGSPA